MLKPEDLTVLKPEDPKVRAIWSLIPKPDIESALNLFNTALNLFNTALNLFNTALNLFNTARVFSPNSAKRNPA